jgi:histidinol-phosphate aminotransferase
VSRTFSKAYGLAALRVGYGIMHAKVADMLNRVRQPFNVNALAQVAALAALADTAYVEESRH